MLRIISQLFLYSIVVMEIAIAIGSRGGRWCKALVLVVKIAAIVVRVPVVPATKLDIGVTPPTEGGPIVLTGRECRPAK